MFKVREHLGGCFLIEEAEDNNTLACFQGLDDLCYILGYYFH